MVINQLLNIKYLFFLQNSKSINAKYHNIATTKKPTMRSVIK